MAGGNFTSQNKVIPGAYMNFTSEKQENVTSADRGIATLPLPLSWGPVKTFMLIDYNTDFKKVLGYDILDPKLLLIKESLKRASKILLYRINSGTKASGIQEPLTITAVYEGKRGNDITIKITDNVDIPGSFIVTTYLDGIAIDTQQAAKVEDLVANDYVVFSGEGALTATAGTKLTAGTDTTPTSEDYSGYFTGLEVQEFNTMGLPIEDVTVKGAAAAFIKRMRDTEGKKIQVVLPDYKIADHEGVISVKNGVYLADGTHIDKVKAVAWVAGATAGAAINKDLTYSQYEDAIDVDAKYTNTQIEEALKSGEFLFIAKTNRNNVKKVLVQDDINTFTSFTPTKGRDYSSNRKIRTMDDIGTTIPELWEESYIGKVDATEEGVDLFKGDINSYFTNLQRMNAVKNFDSNTDINITINPDDSAYAEVGVQLVGSFKKLYMLVKLQ